jgi:hypothetical protein
MGLQDEGEVDASGREEDLANYYRALEDMTRWSHYYNYQRPHSALIFHIVISSSARSLSNDRRHRAIIFWKG